MLTGCSSIINTVAFHPDKRGITSELPDNVVEKYIPTSDGLNIHSLFLTNSKSDKILIYFHGNAGNIYHRLPDLQQLSEFGLNVLGVSYRGYGKSPGSPSEKGLYTDGKGALKYAKENLGFQNDKIYIFGRSIGTTVAINTTVDQNIKGLILVSPLTTGKEQAQSTALNSFSFLAGDSFDNRSKVESLKCPVLVVHGTHDEIIPFAMGEEIYNKLESEKSFSKIDGAGHNDLSSKYKMQYWESIYKFIAN